MLAQLQPRLEKTGWRAVSCQQWAKCPSNGFEPYGIALATRAPLGPLEGSRRRALPATYFWLLV